MSTPSGPPPPPAAATFGAPDADAARAWLAASPAALGCCDALGRLRWANPAALAMLGAGATEQAALSEILALDTASADRLRAALAAGGNVELRRGDLLEPRWLQLELRALAGGERLFALTSLDALKAAAAETQRLSEVLQLAREIGRIGAWERDVRSGRGVWDKQTFLFLGAEGDAGREGEAPRFEQAVARVLESDRPAQAAAFRNSLARAGSYSHRYRARGSDGVIRHLDAQWVVRNGADGTPERVTGLVMDDTQAWALARSYDEMVSQLTLAVDLAGIGIWRHDLATNRMHYNAQAYASLGLEPRPQGLSIAEVRALVHPDDLAQVLASAASTLASGRPTDTEARYRRSDGEWRTVMTRRAVQRDAEGRALAFIGVALDITDRIDEARRNAELGRRFELATRAAGIGYWSQESGQEHVRWSAEMRAIHGVDGAAPAPTSADWLDHHVHPEDQAVVRQRLEGWQASGRDSLESDFRIVRPDGETRFVMTHSLIEGRAPHSLMFGLVIDVTERRRTEMALREAGERASLAARGAGLGTWEVDLRSGAAHWDEQMWRLRGLEPRSAPPSAGERMSLVHPDDRNFVERWLVTPTDDAEIPANNEFRVLLPDGRVRWLASRSTQVCDEHGNPVRRIGVNWDVTDSRTGAAVRQEREIALRESQAKSKFLARMSHELRTPLNAVLGFAQLLQFDETGEDDASAVRRRRTDHIRAAGQHLLELINDVLDLSSLEGGELRIALQPVALEPLVHETLPLLEPLLREHRIELVTGALDVVPLADATRLRQLLLNLLGNAIKYNRAGGRVSLESERRGSTVVIRVSDTGRGMSDLQLRHLFEPFNRLGIEREGIEGTGIGLAIVKALVERMGGSVHVDSTPGTGSVFELRLANGSTHAPVPAVAEPAPPPAPVNAAPAAAPALRGTLLYVEDNPVNALIISELIARRSDLRLHIAPDGLSGVRMALELRPDLVLLDMQLPDIDGHEVLRRLRADERTQRIPVIALSANAMPEDIERALRAGMSDYWTKPLDFRAFMASIDSLFGPAG